MLQGGACLTCVFCFIFGGCGGTLTTASGMFSSPNYPLPYHPSAECYWNIRTNQGSQLFLSFSDFHLEASNLCSFDYLAVSVPPGSRQGEEEVEEQWNPIRTHCKIHFFVFVLFSGA